MFVSKTITFRLLLLIIIIIMFLFYAAWMYSRKFISYMWYRTDSYFSETAPCFSEYPVLLISVPEWPWEKRLWDSEQWKD